MLQRRCSAVIFQRRPFTSLGRIFRATSRESFFVDPQRILLGIKYERDKGFINANGRQTNFHGFLESGLSSHLEDPTSVYPKDKLTELCKDARNYPEMTTTAREEFCDEVSEVFQDQSLVDRPQKPQTRHTDPVLPDHPTHFLVGFDFETNGLEAARRLEVVEFAAMAFSTGNVFHSLVNPGPGCIWSTQAESVHKIPREVVMNELVYDWEQVWKKFAAWIKQEAEGKDIVLVAHNGKRFDFPILVKKTGKQKLRNWSYLDSCFFAQSLQKQGLIKGKCNLSELKDEFGIEAGGESHRADVDVINMAYVFKHLLSLESTSPVSRITQLMQEDSTCFGRINDLGKNSKQEKTKVARKRKKIKWEENVVTSVLDKIEDLEFLGATKKKRLLSVGFENVLQLLRHLPRAYVPMVNGTWLGGYEGMEIGIRGTIFSHEIDHRSKLVVVDWLVQIGDLKLVSATQYCGQGTKALSYATNLEKLYPQGTQVIVQGKMSSTGSERLTVSRIFYDNKDDFTPLIPVYPSKKGLKSAVFHDAIQDVIKTLDPAEKLDSSSTTSVEEYSPRKWLNSLIELHKPRSLEHLEEAKSIIRFHDLMCLNLLLLAKKNEVLESANQDSEVIMKNPMTAVAKSAFQHQLTESQEQCLKEILDDMASEVPMLRILQGDVGSGKTIVAFIAMFTAFGNKLQSAMMVPTEILAIQHFQTLTELIANCPGSSRPTTELLTSSTKRSVRLKILEDAKNGEVDMIIGTHSLLNKEINFANLSLVVVDEQHKFGVFQRQGLKLTGRDSPHLLMMSATPIPRSLALAMRGTTAVSSLGNSLPWRKPVRTEIIGKKDLDRMYAMVIEELERDGRVYVVFPIIEESKSEKFKHLKAAESEIKVLQKTRFKNYDCGLIHGRMSVKEKEEAFNDFLSGKTQVLISTTVIEVGIDVKEASVMIIYHPERFGLAQLHQLRGRVGRGDKESICFLVPTHSVERIEILTQSNDGNKIAYADLLNRGPGEFFGVKQSGRCSFFTYSWESMIENYDTVESAANWASQLLDKNDGTIPTDLAALMKTQGFPSLEDFEI